MWQNTSESDRCADKRIEFLVTANGKLKMARRDALDLEILGSIACKFKHFGSQVLEDSRQVDRGLSANARLVARNGSEMTLYTAARKLYKKAKVSALVPTVKAEIRSAG